MPTEAVIRHAPAALVAASGLALIGAGVAHVALPGADLALGGWPVALGLLAALGLCAQALLGGAGEER